MQAETRQDRYVLGHSSRELDRLRLQNKAYEPFTLKMLKSAGFAPGMRVLDVGTGAGDVALLASEIVGSNGSVVGIDASEKSISFARSIASEVGAKNVEFAVGDMSSIAYGSDFDAVIGRFVLMYSRNAAHVLQRLKTHLKPGGIVAFQEMDFHFADVWPECPTVRRCIDLVMVAMRGAGVNIRMGSELYGSLAAIGIPEPSIRLDAAIDGGTKGLGPRRLAEIARTLFPALEAKGLTGGIELDTLEETMRTELIQARAVLSEPGLIAAWGRCG